MVQRRNEGSWMAFDDDDGEKDMAQARKHDDNHLERAPFGLGKLACWIEAQRAGRQQLCMAGYNEKRLLHDLLDSYNILERPVVNESDPLQLSFGLTLMQIIDVDEKNQLLVTNIWLKLYCEFGEGVIHGGRMTLPQGKPSTKALNIS
uniref:Neurotransmitter-gated ion-channel ligand-binding domain-containing protein n=1 Tax=Anopheles atroparvus TaxID=41427 RepID=A0A182J6B5_ANOAO